VDIASYYRVYNTNLLCIRETAPLEEYAAGRRAIEWTDAELRSIRLVLRKLTSIRIFNPEDAEDLVQETLLTMLRKAPGTEIEKGNLIWAMGILRRKVGNYYRRSQRSITRDKQMQYELRRPARIPSPESSLHHAELMAAINSILVDLAPPEREALDLYLAGKETCEIVSMLQPERYQNIVNWLHRGRKKLVKELARYGYFRDECGQRQRRPRSPSKPQF